MTAAAPPPRVDDLLARLLADRRFVLRFGSGSSYVWQLSLRRDAAPVSAAGAAEGEARVHVHEVWIDMHDPMGGHATRVEQRTVSVADARLRIDDALRDHQPYWVPAHRVRLRLLDGARSDDVAVAQRVLDDAADYFTLSTGARARRDEAQRMFADVPPGRDAADKRVWAAYAVDEMAPQSALDVEELVAVVDLLRGWPTPERAMIGLLVVRQRYRRRGAATSVLDAVERVVRDELGHEALRIAILEQNAPAFAFWQARGFVATGETKPWSEGSVSSRVFVLEKPLAPTSAPA